MGVWGGSAQEYGSQIGLINSLGALAAIPFGVAIGIPFAVASWSPYCASKDKYLHVQLHWLFALPSSETVA